MEIEKIGDYTRISTDETNVFIEKKEKIKFTLYDLQQKLINYLYEKDINKYDFTEIELLKILFENEI